MTFHFFLFSLKNELHVEACLIPYIKNTESPDGHAHPHSMMKTLTIPTLLTKTDIFANSVDPNEMAHNESSHHDLQCLPFCV